MALGELGQECQSAVGSHIVVSLESAGRGVLVYTNTVELVALYNRLQGDSELKSMDHICWSFKWLFAVYTEKKNK